MKVILTPVIILIITFLSQQTKITVYKTKSTVIEVDTMLFSFLLTLKKRRKSPFRLMTNAKPAANAVLYLFKNSRVRYRYADIADGITENKAHHLILYTQVINLPISLIIFLYSKLKYSARKMMKSV